MGLEWGSDQQGCRRRAGGPAGMVRASSEQERIVGLLRRMPSLAASDDARLERLCELVRSRNARAGTVIYSRGESDGPLYLLVQGRARLSLISAEGRELTLSYLEAPATFGASSVRHGGSRAADCVAVTDVELLLMDRADVERAAAIEPGLALDVLAGLSVRLRETVDRLEELAFHDASHRVMRVVFNVATASYETLGAPVVTGLTHYEIAALAGTSRETASRVISALARDGVVLTRGRRILVDLFKLEERLADG
jgi:CRP/FNR family cyclic AMP-dependent transcriptional regulator